MLPGGTEAGAVELVRPGQLPAGQARGRRNRRCAKNGLGLGSRGRGLEGDEKKGAGDVTARSLLPPREDDECAQEVEIIMTPERKPNHVPAEKTPDNAERIRERNGDYAFVSVTTKMFK